MPKDALFLAYITASERTVNPNEHIILWNINKIFLKLFFEHFEILTYNAKIGILKQQVEGQNDIKKIQKYTLT